MAAGQLNKKLLYVSPAPSSMASTRSTGSFATINTTRGHPTDLEFFEDLVSEPVLVLGIDISHLSRKTQFIVTASAVFFFSLLYGFLQELLSVQLCSRQLGLFLAMMQFSGYTVLAYIMRNFVYEKQKSYKQHNSKSKVAVVPLFLYLGLSLLRAIDLGMTNMAMQYINYPAKTLMKSSRVVFTMLFGVLILRKKYHLMDYMIILCMVSGLVVFMHADATSSAIFEPTGVIMLVISLTCDGAISNMSETIMSKYGVGQDEVRFMIEKTALSHDMFSPFANNFVSLTVYFSNVLHRVCRNFVRCCREG